MAENGVQFARPEGCWHGNGDIWFSCTGGGATNVDGSLVGEHGDGLGRIWKLDPLVRTLTSVFPSTGPAVLGSPDDLTVAPSGAVVIWCEDDAPLLCPAA